MDKSCLGYNICIGPGVKDIWADSPENLEFSLDRIRTELRYLINGAAGRGYSLSSINIDINAEHKFIGLEEGK